jgi:uncharacterized protein involved in exopolysaccharide biosynthesis
MSPEARAVMVINALREAGKPTTSARVAAIHLAVAREQIDLLRDADPNHPQLAGLDARLRGMTAQLQIDGVTA